MALESKHWSALSMGHCMQQGTGGSQSRQDGQVACDVGTLEAQAQLAMPARKSTATMQWIGVFSLGSCEQHIAV